MLLALHTICLASAAGVDRKLLSYGDHSYEFREKVPLYANKVGPFHNPRYTSFLSVSGQATCRYPAVASHQCESRAREKTTFNHD